MQVKSKNVQTILEKYRDISLLGKISSVLGWDLNVNLPPKAAEGRATQSAYLTKLIAEKWLDPDFRSSLAKLEKDSLAGRLTAPEMAIVRNLLQGAKFYFRVPKEVIVEFSETTSMAFMAWQKAKDENRFGDFLPHLKKLMRINQIIAKHLGYKDNPYDALLDLYEPGLTAKVCKSVFAKIRPELTSILRAIQKSSLYASASELIGEHMNYPIDDQRQVAMFAIRKMGYDLEAGRMDISSHPFTDTLDHFDVRITNRYKAGEFRESLMVAMHETGHALYEQGVSEDFSYTPLDGGVSLGIHESQSRFWENQVGRSLPFIKFITPILHAFYPEQLSKTGPHELYRLFNQVHPSLIRTEADEVTYNLHIALRFELEEAMVNEKIKIDDLPEIWREKMKKYLGIIPQTDREGVLQDVHWSHGPLGYFPTYTLGNLYAAQFTRAMKKEIKLEELSEKGELGGILSWLRTNIHQHGSLYMPDVLVKKVTGEILNPKYFLDYIKDKYSKLYSLK